MTFSVLNSTTGQKEKQDLFPFFNIEQGFPVTLIIIIGAVSAAMVVSTIVLIKRRKADTKTDVKKEIDEILKDL